MINSEKSKIRIIEVRIIEVRLYSMLFAFCFMKILGRMNCMLEFLLSIKLIKVDNYVVDLEMSASDSFVLFGWIFCMWKWELFLKKCILFIFLYPILNDIKEKKYVQFVWMNETLDTLHRYLSKFKLNFRPSLRRSRYAFKITNTDT